MLSPARPAVQLATAAILAACISVAACAGVSAPKASGSARRQLTRITAVATPAPPAGSRAEAAGVATELLSRLRWPAGARRLAPSPGPASVAPSLWGGATASLDVHELFELPEPMTVATAYLSAHVPAGTSLSVTGQGSGPDGVSADVTYSARSVPAGINAAQLVLTVAPDASGGTIARVDAQVIWYPPRTAAEYIDPARYKALTVAVTIFNQRVHTISKVMTSKAAITQLANALNRSQIEPISLRPSCPLIFATYRLAFAVSLHRKPVVVVTATKNACLGAQISVNGRKQPPLQDEEAVVAIADRLLGATPRP